MTVWVIAGLLGLATGVRIGWALVNKQSLVSAAMIIALGSLALMAALNWPPLTLLVDTWAGRPNLCVGLSQVALITCAAGSSVMITGVASPRSQQTVRRMAILQYGVALVVGAVTLGLFFSAAPQDEMAPAEYLARNLGSPGVAMPWLVPLVYLMFALAVVAAAGIRYSNSSRRGRGLFVFTAGIVLILLSSAFFLIRAVRGTAQVGIGTAVVLLGCAMAVVAAGALLPTVEDWFSGRRELRLTAPLMAELERRQPDIGIGVRPRGPLIFRVAERLSLISDALYLEADAAQRAPAEVDTEPESAAEDPDERAGAVARWVWSGRAGAEDRTRFPGRQWLRRPDGHTDREWILQIARQYRDLAEGGC